MLAIYAALAEQLHEVHEQIQTDLNTLPAEALDWKPGFEMNSVSVIIVHLTGAVRYLVGDVIMQEPSNRDRDAEFRVKGMTKAELIHRLDDTEAYTQNAFEKLTLEDLNQERMHPRRGEPVKVSWALMHALEHAANHLGHIQMTTQLWHQRNSGAG